MVYSTMRIATPIKLTADELKTLKKAANGRRVPKRLVERAQIVLRAAEGQQNKDIAAELGISRPTVQLWRNRFAEKRIAGIEKDATRPGRKPKLSATKVRSVIKATLETTPPGETHWSTRSMAKAQKISRMAVQRIWNTCGLKPHLLETFKLSKDPRFVEKLTDVVGLYLDPPDRALVLKQAYDDGHCRNGASRRLMARTVPPAVCDGCVLLGFFFGHADTPGLVRGLRGPGLPYPGIKIKRQHRSGRFTCRVMASTPRRNTSNH